MAFIQSSVSLRGNFVPTSSVKATSCKPSTTHRMSLADKAISGAKVLLMTGAIVLSTTALAPDADAALFHFRGAIPSNLGVRYGRYLDNCPPSPNCISSMANVYDSHFVPAWTYNAIPGAATKSMTEAIADVRGVLAKYPGATTIKSQPTKSEVGDGFYIYAEFESKLMGFVDDVEFFFQPDNTTVEYRSASRLGERDLGANRKRIRDIRVALQEKDKRWASVGY